LDNEDSTDNNISEKWENIKKRIKEAKQQLIEKDEGTETFKNKWYNEECKFAIEEINKVREKWLVKGRREKEEQEYQYKSSQKLGRRKRHT
jgi:vacuolar-type H+-ATPase subunit H